jgi:hypothetical protein
VYAKKVQSSEPGLIVFLLDDSGSMGGDLPGTSDPKHVWVSRYVGSILKELLARSAEMKGEIVVVKPRFYISFIKYGSNVETWPATQNEPLDIEQAMTLYSTEDGPGAGLGLSGALGGTDTLQAFECAYELLKAAIGAERFRDSFPPMLFHLTDGESATDATSMAARVRELATSDGAVLVVNALLGAKTSLGYSSPADFPGYMDSGDAGPDPYSIRLFEMSSAAPDTIRQNLVDDEVFPKFRSGAALYFDVRTKDMLKHVIQSVGSVGSR